MLQPGMRLGPYEIVAALGAGGMGEVYRARDTRLDRTVALKVLSAKLDATPELRSRFEREARAVAALQHPHICVLHDIGNESGVAFLVMEYLAGETLAARLRHGPLPFSEAVTLGGQIAAALERAHRAGIVHRDLKPANIMLTPGGAKLLDFGLAKPGIATAAATDAPTVTTVTQPGLVMGTIPYMAPEQLAGREADTRSDLYAFGCVLYEMATGESAYKGTHAVEPAALHALIQACLMQNPDERVQSAHDAGLMLAAAANAPSAVPATRKRRWLWPAAVALTAAMIAAAGVWMLRPAPQAPRMSTEITPPPSTHFGFGGVHPGPPVISPDGTEIVYLVRTGSHSALWLRSLDRPDAHELPGTSGAALPFWSPDGRKIAFAQSATEVGVVDTGALMVLNLAGGAPRELAPVGTFRGGTWLQDGTVVYAPDSAGGLMRIAATGGTPHPLLSPSGEVDSLRYPYALPDGQHYLYMTVSHADPTRDMIYEASLNGHMNRALLHARAGGIYSDGDLLYSDQGTLLAQRLDPSNGELSGSPQPVATGVYQDAQSWRPAYSVSRSGVLAYAAGSSGAGRLAWANRAGVLSLPLPPFTGQAVQAEVSPDGKQFALAVDNGVQDIWTEANGGASATRLTFGGAHIHSSPVWSPNGRDIVYSDRDALYRVAATGGVRQSIGQAPPGTMFFEPAGWSSTGEILCMRVAANGVNSIVALPANGHGKSRTIATVRNMTIAELELSPDGHWVTYLAGAPGQPENVYMIPFHGDSGSVWQATDNGAVRFFWVKDGRELDVIQESGKLLAFPVTVSGGAPVLGAAQTIADPFPDAIAASPDGQRFLAVTYPDDHQRLRILTGWRHS